MIAALVPAAGRSVRMGRPKLLMEFQGESLIHRVVSALLQGGAERVVVVAPADGPASSSIAAEAAAAGAEVVVPEIQPPEMRDSVELGLAVLETDPRPRSILLTPGDVPGITPALVVRLVQEAREQPGRIVIPTHDGHRGHPIVLPWSIALQIRDLSDDDGVNVLVDRHGNDLLELPVSAPGAIEDVDTPDDLERWSAASLDLDRSPPTDATMKVCVRLFALAKERAGRAEVEVELSHDFTVAGLREALLARIPHLGGLCGAAMIAVDEEYASDDTAITANSRVAMIPPVSGGAPGVPGRMIDPRTRNLDPR